MDHGGNQASVFPAIVRILARWLANLITTIFRRPSGLNFLHFHGGTGAKRAERRGGARAWANRHPSAGRGLDGREKEMPACTGMTRSLLALPRRKQHRVVGKGLELKRVATGIEKEHRRLLTRQPLEANIRRNAKGYARRADALGQFLPLRHRQHHTEMRHGHIMSIDRIGRSHRARIGVEMRHDLMAIKIKIDPMLRTAPLATAQHTPVKGAGGIKIMNGKGKVKRAHGAFLPRVPVQTNIEFAPRPL